MESSGHGAGPHESGDVTEGDGDRWSGRDRRRSDRRARPTRPWTDLFAPKRRADGRRESDQAGYVDRYSRRDVTLMMSIFLLNVLDAYFTMRWLDRGGREANPVMDFFIDIGPGAFLVQKCLIVGFWLLVLLVHKNFRMARLGLYASLGVYIVLLGVHFLIVAFDVEPPKQVDVPQSALMKTVSRPTSE